MKWKWLFAVASFILWLFVVFSGNWMQNNPAKGSGSVVSDEVKRAIYKMGPGYSYRLLEDGTLQVWQDGEWLRLRY